MSVAHDKDFASAVLKRNLANRESVHECIRELKSLRHSGSDVSLDALMVSRGVVTRSQADEILKEIERARPVRSIGGFELIQQVGRGGMCTVYKARQVSMDRIVALKVLSESLAGNKAYIERFFREARAVAKLSHINIIQGYDVGEAPADTPGRTCYYFAMEYVDGESVAARLASRGKFGEAEALAVVEQIARALSHAQSAAHIVHGDIKPDNIMLAKDGVAKLADLGLAKAVGETTDIVAGTPHYVSPEQGRGRQDIDVRSDIYSLGATLFHMITGGPPFNGATPRAIIEKHLNEDLPSPRSLNPALSFGICRLIATMMAKEREDRYQTADELLQDIRLVRDGLPPARAMKIGPASAGHAVSTRNAQRVSSSAAVAVMVVFIVLVIGGGTYIAIKFANTKPMGRKAVDDPAAAAYEDALAFAKANPWETDQCIARFQDVAKRFPGTTCAEKALAEVRLLQDQRENQAAEAFRKTRIEADKQMEAEHYFKAESLWDGVPDSLRFGHWAKDISDQKQQIAAKARERVNQLNKEAAALAARQEYVKAGETLKPCLAFGYKDVKEKATEKIARYEELEAKRKEKQREEELRKAEEAYAKLVTAVASLEAQRRFDDAVKECDDYARKCPEQFGTKVDDLKRDIQAAQRIWDAALRNLHDLQGKAVEIRARGILLKGKLRSLNDEAGTFVIDSGSAIYPPEKLANIDPETALTLAGVAEPDAATRATFFISQSKLHKAREEIGRVQDKVQREELERKLKEREQTATTRN